MTNPASIPVRTLSLESNILDLRDIGSPWYTVQPRADYAALQCFLHLGF